MASVLDLVKHYQHTIEKYPTDENKVLKCIDKLYKLAVTVQHLQETGVGRTVNALRKETGDVGQASRALVYKWKLMVAAEESDQETDQNNDCSTHNGHGSGKDSDDNAQSRTKPDRYERSHSSSKPKDHREINGNYSGSKKRYHSSEDEEPNTKRSKHSSSSEDDYKRKPHDKVKKPETESESDGSQSYETDSEESDSSQEEVKVKQEIKKEHSSHKSSSSKHFSHDEHAGHKSSSSSRPYEPEKHSRHHSSQSKERHSSETSSTKEKSNSSDKHKSSKEKESSSEKKHKTEHKSDAEKSHKDSKSSARHSLGKPSSSDKHHSSDKHSSSEKHGSSDKHRSSSSHKSESGSDKNKTSSDKHSKSDKHKSSSHSHAPEKEKHKSSSEKDSERSKHKVKESNSSSSKEKHSSSSKDKSKDSSSSKDKLSSHSSEKKHSSSSDNKSNSSRSKGHSEKNDEKSDKKSKHNSSSSSHKSSKSGSGKNEEIPKKKVQIQIGEDHDTDDGIDCGSGASFAEALGMISPVKSKKKLLRDAASPINDYSPAVLLAPTAKLAPLPALEISALPEISPNYKPRPPPRAMPHFNDEDSMSCVISSKNQRTKVYSGNKVIGGKIPSLYEMCVNVLQEHIDALEYTGGVPYEILKPVVDRATPQQLFILEHYNPYLMEDTDHLWQKFCQKNFRNKQRQENEAWREMYSRCQEEQEIRLKSLTNNIRIAQEAKKAPIKQTKMAYVDSIAKPPRNIAKKQAQHGTARLATGSPAARVASLAAGPNVLRGGVGARAMAPLPSSGGSSFKPKKAPLMAKALQIMRGRKR